VGFFRGLPSPAGAWLVVSSVAVGVPQLSLAFLLIGGVLMCSFYLNWIHFNRMLNNLRLVEISAALIISVVMGHFFALESVIAGPIFVYLFTPIWRRPQ